MLIATAQAAYRIVNRCKANVQLFHQFGHLMTGIVIVTGARDRSWRTPLHYAAESGNCDVISQLLDYGSDPTVRDSVGTSPLHLSVSRLYIRIPFFYLKKSISPCSRSLKDNSIVNANVVGRCCKFKQRLIWPPTEPDL